MRAQGLPQPSFAIGALAMTPLSSDTFTPLDAILDAVEELQALILGQLPLLLRMASPTVSLPSLLLSLILSGLYRLISS